MSKICLLVVFFLVLIPVESMARLQPSEPAPRFSLNDIQGKQVDISHLNGRQLLILYFFDMDSRPSLEGLNALDRIARQYKSELAVFGISASPNDVITRYIKRNNISIQIFLDTARVRDLYHANQIMPVGCIIGPGFKVIEYHQGGGQSLESAMLKTVKRELQGRVHSSSDSGKPAKKTGRPTAKKPDETHAKTTPEQTPRNLAGKADEEAKHGKVGKIINDTEW